MSDPKQFASPNLVSSSSAPSDPPQSIQQKAPFLRRCSISDPHLDIVPHFLKDEKTLNPFNRMLSGLFERGSNFSLNSTDSIDRGGVSSPNSSPNNQAPLINQLKKENSANEMLQHNPSTPISGPAGLRKSATSASALYGSNFPSQAVHPFPTIPETEGQGLVMTARPNNKSTETGGTMATSPPKSGYKGLFGAASFLSKPVVHSQEENYRLIMALDR